MLTFLTIYDAPSAANMRPVFSTSAKMFTKIGSVSDGHSASRCIDSGSASYRTEELCSQLPVTESVRTCQSGPT